MLQEWESYFNLARLLSKEKKYKEANQAFLNTINLNSSNWEIYYEFGNMLFESGNADEALTAYQKAININNQVWQVHFKVGNLFFAFNQFKYAIQNFEAALNLNYYCPEAVLQICHSYQRMGLQKKYLEYLEKAVELCFDMGNQAFWKSEFLKAHEMFIKTLSLKPDFAEALFHLGNTQKKLGRDSDAIVSFQKALYLRPEWPEARNNLSEAFFSIGKIDDAISECQKVIEIDKKFADAYMNLGHYYLSKSNINASNESYNQAKALFNNLAQNNKGDIISLSKSAKIKIIQGKPNRVNNKLAFYMGTMSEIAHFKYIWKHLNRDFFDVIVSQNSKKGREGEYRQLRSYLENQDVNLIDCYKCVEDCITYEYLISMNYYKEHLFTGIEGYNLAKKHIRYVRHNAWLWKNPWNDMCWLFLCQGAFQYNSLLSSGYSRVLMTGYPRFDNYFTEEFDTVQIKKNFSCDPHRKTILWIINHFDYDFSRKIILRYYHYMAKLSDQYNVILKPHPISFWVPNQYEIIKKIEKEGLIYICPPQEDDSYLFSIIDYVFSDTGGSPFTAIYLDINLALLARESTVHPQFKGKIINIPVERADELPDVLSNKNIWDQQKIIRKKLREFLFTPYYGYSGKIVSDVLMNLEHIT